MKNSPIFADKLRYLPFKILSQKAVRSFFVRHSGAESSAFTYRNDLSGFARRLIILPQSLAQLSVFIPFLLDLSKQAKPGELVLLGPEEFQPLLKALGLESNGLSFSKPHLRYGEEHFQKLEQDLRGHHFDLCIMLESNPDLPILYLAKTSGATYRIGLDCEAHYPFLNMSFRGGMGSPLAFRTHLEGLFGVSPHVHQHSLERRPGHLSSQHVILLNLEPSLAGQAWTEGELTELTRLLDPHYRLLALAPDHALLDSWGPLLERLAIRTAPIANSYSAFMDLLRQYCGLVTLNSHHAHLAIHVSRVPTILLSEPNIANWIPNDCPDVHTLERGKPFPADMYAVLTQSSR